MYVDFPFGIISLLVPIGFVGILEYKSQQKFETIKYLCDHDLVHVPFMCRLLSTLHF